MRTFINVNNARKLAKLKIIWRNISELTLTNLDNFICERCGIYFSGQVELLTPSYCNMVEMKFM